jgi:hypothetical protein
LREDVVRHVSPLNLEDLLALVISEPVLRVAVQRLLGLNAKLVLLRKSYEEWVERPLRDVSKAVTKLDKDIVKLARPKHAARKFTDAELEQRRYTHKVKPWQDCRHRYNDASNRIFVFNHYDSYSGGRDTAWWQLMTEQQTAPSFVRDHHDHHDHHAHATAAVASSRTHAREHWDDAS